MTTRKNILCGLDPLSGMLSDMLSRLEVLEGKAGIGKGTGTSSVPKAASPGASAPAGGEAPTVKAYDAYVKSSVVPFSKSCDDLGGLENIGTLVQQAWEGVRTIVVLSSRAKAPKEDLGTALMPFLAPTQEAVKKISQLRLKRDWDRHQKAVVEMLSCLSWIMMKAPQQLPAASVRGSLEGAEFWTNRIRKDYKGKDDKQIAFCDSLKICLSGLVEYIESFHKTGLAWNNAKGISLAEAGIRLSDDPVLEPPKSPRQKRHPTLGSTVPGSNVAGLMGELSKRKSADGSSAATGLKSVSRDQQTWRKEYKKQQDSLAVPSLDEIKKESKKVTKKKPLRGIPIFEYQDRGFKWVVENHTKASVEKEITKEGFVTVNITDPKEQVYIYNCEGITVVINGKFKSLILDKCVKCAVVFETLISSAELVNCKSVQTQVKNICPVFTIDKTEGVVIYLSEESAKVSTITTSMSSEMNVTIPDGDTFKEIPIPEQFVHKIEKGGVTSEVSELYR